ncbi:hypothetical protein QQ008_03270 [Fulvivirgaceae bacterium BMA10]|uniref:Uncharacterized protein n=1 Tax=Splendidivirga corallicola TaxID=3051826 RepID=A0ABT8KJX6_9BACT|nr:hypothetical protein [Fulvivirgaceae bacterium BMA10]
MSKTIDKNHFERSVFTLALNKLKLLRALLAIGFIFLYLGGLLKPIAPLIEYYANQDYIAEFLCINKDEPITVCNGQCYLANKLKDSQQEENQEALPGVKMEDYPIGIRFNIEVEELRCHYIQGASTPSSNLYHYLYSKAIFHPPVPQI